MKDIIKRIISWIICRIYGIEGGKYSKMPCDIKISKNGWVRLGRNVSFSKNTLLLNVTKNASISFGDNCRIAHHFQISSANKVIVGKNVNIAPFVFITDHNHEYKDIFTPILSQGILMDKDSMVVVGDDSWIGNKVTIAGNVKIGKHCVIGANSVVTKDIPDYCVAAGIPAKVIKKYNIENRLWERV